MIREDYIMRIIHEAVRTLLKLLFGIEEEKEEEIVLSDAVTAEKYKRLCQLARQGQINQAENQLWEQLDGADQEDFKMAILFYEYLNQMTDEQLEQGDYSREEISQGLLAAAKQYGYDGMVGALLS
ncbi:MAG: hypothetical protein HFI41_14610 [Lachnospiraceae bacterium]|nr:hypothetical protein [Lachnospiraceae bacterium]